MSSAPVVPEHATRDAIRHLRGKNAGSYGKSNPNLFACNAGLTANTAGLPFMGVYTAQKFLTEGVFSPPRCTECTRLVLEALSIRTHPTKTRWK